MQTLALRFHKLNLRHQSCGKQLQAIISPISHTDLFCCAALSKASNTLFQWEIRYCPCYLVSDHRAAHIMIPIILSPQVSTHLSTVSRPCTWKQGRPCRQPCSERGGNELSFSSSSLRPHFLCPLMSPTLSLYSALLALLNGWSA